MKKQFKLILVALGLCLVFAFTACGKGAGGGTGTGGAPSQSDWESFGVTSAFDADVKGTRKVYSVANGSVDMKWSDSDEESLDNTIAWLRGQDFTNYGTNTAGKEYLSDGALISYTAAKTTSGANSESGGLFSFVAPARTVAATREKTVVAEAVFATKNISVQGVTMKRGELFVTIEEETEVTIPSPTSTTWQGTAIQEALGASLPAYTGAKTSFYTQTNKLGIGFATVTVNGAQQSGAEAYRTALIADGFVSDADDYTDMKDPNEVNAINYVKNLANGNKITVTCAWVESYNIDDILSGNFNGSLEYAVVITARLEKVVGELSAWPTAQLSAFSGAGLPTYTGNTATTFDFSDAWAEMGVTMPELPDLGIYGGLINLLPAEERAEYEAAMALYEEVRKSFQYIRVYLVTVYRTTEAEVNGFATALKTAGFTEDYNEYTKAFKVGNVDVSAEIEIDFDHATNKATIAITRLPKALTDYQDTGY